MPIMRFALTAEDTADIYAVIYEVNPQKFVALNGDDVLTSDRIVMMARIADPGEPAEWKRFEEPFRLLPGKTFSDEQSCATMAMPLPLSALPAVRVLTSKGLSVLPSMWTNSA